MDEKRVRVLGLPPMTEREYKIYNKRQAYIKAGKLEDLAKFDQALAKQSEKKVEKEINKEDIAQ